MTDEDELPFLPDGFVGQPPAPEPIDIGADLDTMTFHTGGRKAIEEMITNGTFSGFRAEVPGTPNFVGRSRKKPKGGK